MFKVGQRYASTCIFTGGLQKYEVISRTEDKVTFRVTANEIDGTHDLGSEEYDILKDEEGEKVRLWEYAGHEGFLYAVKEEV